MPKADVIVIGAGPAGCAAAHAARVHGLSVVLVDRYRFPRTKPCGGMLSMGAIHNLPFPLFRIPATHYREIRVRLPRKQEVRQATRGFLVRRSEFDFWLVRSVTAAGVRFIHASPRAIKERNNYARVMLDQHGFVDAPVVIACDGANSRVRRLLGRSAPPTSVSLEFDREGEPGRDAPLFDFAGINDGYDWVFPKTTHSNLGRIRFNAAKLGRRAALTALGYERDRDGPVVGAAVGVFGPDHWLGQGRVLVAGDAAGLADPLTGEGIMQALWSGQAAGLSAGAGDDALQHYHARMAPLLRAMEERLSIARSLYVEGDLSALNEENSAMVYGDSTPGDP